MCKNVLNGWMKEMLMLTYLFTEHFPIIFKQATKIIQHTPKHPFKSKR